MANSKLDDFIKQARSKYSSDEYSRAMDDFKSSDSSSFGASAYKAKALREQENANRALDAIRAEGKDPYEAFVSGTKKKTYDALQSNYSRYLNDVDSFGNDISSALQRPYTNYADYADTNRSLTSRLNDLAERNERYNSVMSKMDGYSPIQYNKLTNHFADLSSSLNTINQALLDADPYSKYSSKDDWSTKSKYSEDLYNSNFNVKNAYNASLYAAVNGDERGKNYFDSEIEDPSFIDSLQYMSDYQKQLFNYIYSTDGADAAKSFLDELRPTLNEEQRRVRTENAEKWASQSDFNRVLASLQSVALSPFKGAAFLAQLVDLAGDGKIDQNAGYNSANYLGTALRSGASKGFSNTGEFLYQTGMSIADFLVQALASGSIGGGFDPGSTAAKLAEAASLGLMGTGAAADTVIESKDRGMSDGWAMAMGTVAGIAEIVTEKISIENLLKPDRITESTMRRLIRNAVAEGSEEGFSDLINWSVEALVTAVTEEPTEFREAVENYIASGMSERQAWLKAVKDRLPELGLDILGGAISGGVMSGGQMALEANSQVGYGKNILSNGDYSALYNLALNLPENSSAYQYAQNMPEQAPHGLPAGDFLNRVADEALNKDTNVLQQISNSRQVGRLGALTQVELNQMAEGPVDIEKAVQESRSGKKISPDLLKEIKYNDYAKEQLGIKDKVNKKTLSKIINERTNALVEYDKKAVENYAKSLNPVGQRVLVQMYSDAATSQNAQDYIHEAVQYYNMGIDEAEFKYEPNNVLNEVQAKAMYEAGVEDINNGGKNNAEVRKGVLPQGVQGNDSKSTGVGTRGLEERSGGNQAGSEARQGNGGSPNFVYGKESLNTKDLGVTGGVNGDKTLLKVESGHTDGMKRVESVAKARGYDVVWFANGNLAVKNKGKVTTARALIDPESKTIYIRADHGEFSPEMLGFHELAHDMIKKGEIDVQSVSAEIRKSMSDEDFHSMIEDYQMLFRNRKDPMSVWTEIVCDAMGGMNSFKLRGSELRDKYAPILSGIRSAAESTAKREITRNTHDMEFSEEKTAFNTLFNTLSDGRVQIINHDDLSTEDWKLIQKAVKRIGYDVRSASDAKNVYKGDYTFNKDQSEAIKIEYGVTEKARKSANPKREALARKTFGTTGNFREAGYLMRNGSMLDFSGKKDGGPRNTRAMDHREINSVFEDGEVIADDYFYGSATPYMNAFISEGNIRLMDGQGVTIGQMEPTSQQYTILKQFVDHVLKDEDYFYLDLQSDNGYTIESREYTGADGSSRIIRDIKGYFKDGALPYKSGLSAFFSEEADAKYLDAVKSGDMKTAQDMVDDAAKEAGFTVKAYHGTTKDFTEFSRKEQGKNHDGYLQYGAGFYFTPSSKEAVEWVRRGRSGRSGKVEPKIMSVYLNPGRIIDADAPIDAVNPLQTMGLSKADALFICGRTYRFINYLLEEKGFSNIEVQEELKSLGIDAIKATYNRDTSGEYVIFDPEQIKSADPVTYDDNGEVIPLSKRFDDANRDIRFSEVTDKELIDELNKSKTVDVYRSMQLVNGNLYPPMSAKYKDENGRWQWKNPIELNKWYKSDEDPSQITRFVEKDGRTVGKTLLNKGNGSSPLEVVYNPYNHSTRGPLNDQFMSAFDRPELVLVKAAVPESEIKNDNPYWAQYAGNPVGETDWKEGPVSKALDDLGKPRKVILSQYVKITDILTPAETAKLIANELAGIDVQIPVNTVTPAVRKELEKLGVKLGPPQKQVANKFKRMNPDVKFSEESDADYLKAVKDGDMTKARQYVLAAAEANQYKIAAYHGTGRADRVGTVFRPDRATSGPMAFFTDNEEIAKNYSRSKRDTSISYDTDYDSYETQFRSKKNGVDRQIDKTWYLLAERDRQNIRNMAEHVYEDDDGNIVYDEDNKNANGGFDWQIKEARGNIIRALVNQWLNSGTLFNKEGDFLKVLELSGVTAALKRNGFETPRYMDPDYRDEKVYNVFLRIQNPFDATKQVNEQFVRDFEEWADEQDMSKYNLESVETDLWDKRSVTAEMFAERMRNDIKRGESHAWTAIPDIMTDYLKSLGYDGIVDKGGKNGGAEHIVYVPFYSEQVKSADTVVYDDKHNIIPLSERFNAAEKDIRFSEETDEAHDRPYAPVFYSKLERLIESYKGDKIGVASIPGMLNGKISKEEQKWSGIDIFTEGRKSVLKSELLEFLRNYRAENEIVELQNSDTRGPWVDKDTGEVYENLYYFLESAKREADYRGDNRDDVDIDFNDDEKTLTASVDGYVIMRAEPERPTKWKQYTSVKGGDYREYLYKIPTASYSNEAMRTHWNNGYTPAKGIIAHARVHDASTIEADGDYKYALFIEEIQSDWHNAGGKYGYLPENEEKENQERTDLRLRGTEARQKWIRARSVAMQFVFDLVDLDPNNTEDRNAAREWVESDSKKTYEELEEQYTSFVSSHEYDEDAIHDYSEQLKEVRRTRKEFEDLKKKHDNYTKRAPEAPYKNTYTDFVLKNLLRKAAEEGYDYLAWTPAIMQLDRWNPHRWSTNFVTGEGPTDDVAFQKAYENEYDKKIPGFLKKYGKLTEIEMAQTGDMVPAIEITDDIKESVLYAGQPSFSEANEELEDLYQKNEDLKRQIKDLSAELKRRTEQKEHWKDQTKRTKKRTIRDEDAKRVANDLSKAYEADIDITKDIKSLAETVLADLYNPDLDNDDTTVANITARAKAQATEIARKLLSKTQKLNDYGFGDTWKSIKQMLRNTRLYVPENIRNDISGDYNDFRKSMFGTMNLTSDPKAQNISEFYSELRGQFGNYLFPDDITHEAEMIQQISDVLHDYKPVLENLSSYDIANVVDYVADELVERVLAYDVKEKAPTFADKMQARIDDERKKGQLALTRVRKNRDRALNLLRQHHAQVAMDARERRAKSAAQSRLLKIAKRLNNRKLPAVNKQYLMSIIGDLDLLSKGITKKRLSELTELREEYRQLQEFYPGYKDEETEAKIERLEKRRIKDMTQEEVAELTEVLLAFENAYRTAKKAIESKMRHDYYVAGVATMEDIKNSTGYKSEFVDKYVTTQTLTPEREIHRVTGYVDNDPMYILTKELSTGQRNAQDYTMRAYNMFSGFTNNRKFMDRITGKNAETIKVTGVDAKTGKDTEVKITPAMRMSIYLHSLNEDNMRHITEGGLNIPDIDLYKKGDIERAYQENIYKFTEQMVRRITSGMTPEERAFAKAISTYFNTMSKEEINRVSEQLVGYSIATVDNYFPINTDKAFVQKDFSADAMADNGSIKNMGWTKERVKSGAPIMLYDATTVLNQSISQHAKYVGLAIPVRNFNMLWNEKMGKGISESVRSDLKGKWGTRAVSYVDKMMKDIQMMSFNPDVYEEGFAKLRSKYASAVLSLNASVAMKQAASYPTAAVIVGWQPLIKALKDGKSVDINLIAKYTPDYWYRSKGFSTIELAEIVKQGKTLPKALNWIQAVDLATTRTLWKAAEYYVQANSNLQVGTNEYYKEVANVYNRIIEETQPNYTTMQRPQVLRSQGTLTRALNMFKTQPFQNFNILYDSIENYKAKLRQNQAHSTEESAVELARAKSTMIKAVSSQAVSAFIFSLMQFLWDWFRKKKNKYANEEGDITFASRMKGMGINTASSIAGMVPFGGTVLEFGEALTDVLAKAFDKNPVFDQSFYGLSENATESVNDALSNVIKLSKTVAEAVKGDLPAETVMRTIVDMGADIAQVAGVPANNVINLATAVAGQAASAIGNIEYGDLVGEYNALRIVADPETQKSAYYDLLYKAYKRDKAQYKEILKSMYKEGFTEDKVKTNIEKRMKKEQGVTSVKDLSERWCPD